MNKPICGIYRHYKGEVYEVIDIAKHSETSEELVVYKNISTDECWVRPVSMWNETVLHHGEDVLRFQYIASDIDDMDSKRLFQTIEDIVEFGEMYDALSDDNCIAYCRKSTGEVTRFMHRMGYYTDEEIDDGTLNDREKAELEKLNFIADNMDDYVLIPQGKLLEEYEIMESFAYELPGVYQEKLLSAIQGKGAFRRFKDTVHRLGLSEHWYHYRDYKYRREARMWCDAMDVHWRGMYINSSQGLLG